MRPRQIIAGAVAALAAALVTSAGTVPATAVPEPAGESSVRDYPVPTTGCGLEPEIDPGASTSQRMLSGGVERTYLVHLPATYDPGEPLPVVLAFHGRKGTGAKQEAFSGLSSLPAIVVYPDGLAVEGKTAWQGAPYSPPTDDVLFVSDLLDELQSTLCVDQNAIYATGKSNGGGFTALLACTLPHRIAAFAPVAGAFYPQTRADCTTDRPVPMMEFHGLEDTIIEYAGGESHGEQFPAVTDWLDDWAERNRCRLSAQTPIGDDVTQVTWTRCAARGALVHYRIAGAGHTWPGELANSGPGDATQTISATEEMWEFFQENCLRRCQ